MKKDSVNDVVSTIGVDLGDKFSTLCVLDRNGAVLEKSCIRTTPSSFGEKFKSLKPRLVVLETGTHANWAHDTIAKLGLRVVVANARKVRAISTNERKCDELDAWMLAQLGYSNERLLQPVTIREEQIRQDLSELRARDALVAARTLLTNNARGLAKSMGVRLPRSSPKSLPKKPLPEEVAQSLKPVIDAIDQISKQITVYETRFKDLCKTRYPQTLQLRRVSGVGLISALYLVLSIGDVSRFKKDRSRAVGAYFGLVPRRDQSGNRDPQLSITKCGDGMGRKLLVQCAHSILARGPDSDLKRFAQKLSAKRGKKRAIIATARKLAGLLYSLLRTGEEYEPLRHGARTEDDKPVVSAGAPPVSRPSRTSRLRSA